ncbi:MAG: hypothetical protein RJB08_145 [Actinomycetota bacterium]
MIKTLICDDHAMVRESLPLVLEAEGDVEVVGAAKSVEEAIGFAENNPIDVALIDLHLGGDSGLRLAERLRSDWPGTRSIIVTGFPSDDLVYEAGRLGVFDIVEKSTSTHELIARIRSAASGRKMLDDFTLRAAKEHLTAEGLIALKSLGATDREILAHIAEGMTDKQISQRVYLSAQTVRNRISRLLGVLGRENRTQLALLVTHLDPHVSVLTGNAK